MANRDFSEEVARIKAIYIARYEAEVAPSITDLCFEYDYDNDIVNAVLKISQEEDWEAQRLELKEATKRAKQRKSLLDAEDTFKGVQISSIRLMKALLLERNIKRNMIWDKVHAKILGKLDETDEYGNPIEYSIGTLLDIGRLCMREGESISSDLINLLKIIPADEDNRPVGGTRNGEEVQALPGSSVNLWKRGAMLIETTGQTMVPASAKDQIEESEKNALFSQLDAGIGAVHDLDRDADEESQVIVEKPKKNKNKGNVEQLEEADYDPDSYEQP